MCVISLLLLVLLLLLIWYHLLPLLLGTHHLVWSCHLFEAPALLLQQKMIFSSVASVQRQNTHESKTTEKKASARETDRERTRGENKRYEQRIQRPMFLLLLMLNANMRASFSFWFIYQAIPKPLLQKNNKKKKKKKSTSLNKHFVSFWNNNKHLFV